MLEAITKRSRFHHLLPAFDVEFSGLDDRLDRDVHDVHTDLHLLADYRIIHFREVGRAKQPSVPYDTVRIEVVFSTSSGEGSETPASA